MSGGGELAPLQRHDLVWLDAASAADAGAFARDARCADIVRDWVAQRRPLVVASQPDDLAAGCVALGISLASPRARQRVCLRVPRRLIVLHWRALPLPSAIESAPPHWRAPMVRIEQLCRRLGIRAGVYGSLAFQILTGQDYLTPDSDLDLLFDCPSGVDLPALLAGLLATEFGALRVDGEVRLPGGWAVPWRELAIAFAASEANAAKAPAQVLAKSDSAVRLIDVDEFVAQFLPLSV